MSREEAVKLVGKCEGKIPWKYVPDFLEYLNITKEEFLANLDRFTNRKLFSCDEKGNIVKDKESNPIRRYQII